MSDLLAVAVKKNRSLKQKYFLDPLVAFSAYGLIKLCSVLPLKFSAYLGGILGSIIGFFMRKKNKIALYNLNKVFPNKSQKERKKILRKMWFHFGAMFAETAQIKKLIQKNTQIIGTEVIEQIKQNKKGGFFISAHIGNWEVCPPFSAQFGLPLHPFYRPANNPWFEKLIFQRRKMPGITLIPKGTSGNRIMLSLLAQKEYMAILVDQKYNLGADVEFLGHPSKTTTAIESLAIKKDIDLIPIRCIRTGVARYKLEIFQPFEIKKTDIPEKDILDLTKRVNDLLSSWIYEYPEQWLWIHHRWDKKEYK